MCQVKIKWILIFRGHVIKTNVEYTWLILILRRLIRENQLIEFLVYKMIIYIYNFHRKFITIRILRIKSFLILSYFMLIGIHNLKYHYIGFYNRSAMIGLVHIGIDEYILKVA